MLISVDVVGPPCLYVVELDQASLESKQIEERTLVHNILKKQ